MFVCLKCNELRPIQSLLHRQFQLAHLVSEPAQEAESPAVLQTEHLKSGGDHHPLLAVVQGRHALEGLEPLMGVLAMLGLVGRHATHGAPEDVRVRAEGITN